MAEIDAILFDIGNVLIEWDPRHLYRKLLPDEAERERFLSEICTPEWHFAHDQGVSFEQNAATLKLKHAEHADLIDQWGARYMEMVPGEVAGMADLLGALANTDLGLHGLTNMPSTILPKCKAQFSLLNHLQTVVVSGDERVCKPDQAIYKLALTRMGTDPSRTLFVDDTFSNTQAAEQLGFHTHWFKRAEGLKAHLGELGVTWA